MESVFDDKGLQIYLNQISEIPALSREEERDLAIKAKNGDQRAIERLIESNLKFVVKIASHYQNRGLSLSELISEGNLGLIKAIRKFDPDKNIKLISYAVWWIRQRILYALAEKTSIIRIPLAKSNTAHKIKSAKDKHFVETGDYATLEEISEETELKEKQIRKIKDLSFSLLSLDEITASNFSDKYYLSDFLEDKSIVDPKELYYDNKVKKSIVESINSLNPRDAHIIKSYFGLNGREAKNFAQIAQELGLSRERVRQIQKKSLKKILNDSSDTLEKDIDFYLKK